MNCQSIQMTNIYNRKSVEDMLPEFVQLKKELPVEAASTYSHLKGFCEEFKQQLNKTDELMDLVRKLRKEVTSVIETTPAMVYKPIAAIDKSLEMLYYHFGQQDARVSKSVQSQSAAKNKSLNEKKTVKQAAKHIKLPQSHGSVEKRSAQQDTRDEKHSHIETLVEKAKNSKSNKYFCACKGKKSLTFESYTNHIFVCHNNLVPEGSSHELDGSLRKRKTTIVMNNKSSLRCELN